MPLIDETTFYESFLKPPADRGLELIMESMAASPMTDHVLRRVGFYNTNPYAQQKQQTHYKSYPYSKSIPLHSDTSTTLNIEVAIESRSSQRNYKNQPMTLVQLSKILKVGYSPREQDRTSRRTAPSGGGRHPAEIYPIVFNVEGLEPGAYHYNVKEGALELIKSGHFAEELKNALDAQPDTLENVSVVIVVTAVYRRTIEKYGDRGWKILLMDIGHLGQNLWLLATSMGVGMYPVAAADEHAITKLLHINKYFELPLVTYCMGVEKDE